MFRFNLSLLCGLLIVAVSFRLSEQTESGIKCPNGWQYFEGSCYAYDERRATWASAQAICAAHGAKLAEIENERENNFLKNIARSKKAEKTFLGGSDMFIEGYWTWASNSRSVDSFTDWAGGKPDYQGKYNDCAVFSMNRHYQWEHAQCDLEYNYICEAPVTSGL